MPRAASLALVAPRPLDDAAADPSARGDDRRTYPRFTPLDLQHRLAARHKYGESVTLLDLSVGGVQLETPRIVRPDNDLVLEIIDSRTREISQVVSRVLRAKVAALDGGIRYRAACMFRRPLSLPTLLAPTATPPSPPRADGPDFLKLELALKTIIEGYFKRPRGGAAAGRWRDASSLLDALVRLRSAAERRRDPVDRQLGSLLATLIPALQRREPTDVVLRKLHDHLGEQLPLLAIRSSGRGDAIACDRERVTLNMSVDGDRMPMAVTAEFPPGFWLDASQFRLLKLSAYLVGLVDHWNARTDADSAASAPARELLPTPPTTAPPPATPRAAHEGDARQPGDLPLGWHRIVLRYMDGQILRGYSNDFSPDRGYLHVSPRINCQTNERMLVPIGRLKAVFFVKDLHGDQTRVDVQTFDHDPRGRKIEVTFRDGEVMTGSTLNYKPNEQGFFVLSANTRGNNIRSYVISAAIRHIRFV